MGGRMIKGHGRRPKTGHVTLIHLIYLISTYASEKSGAVEGKARGKNMSFLLTVAYIYVIMYMGEYIVYAQ